MLENVMKLKGKFVLIAFEGKISIKLKTYWETAYYTLEHQYLSF